ncbi:MAG: sigma factor-like helix-turn-helix DNA-binding protein [Ethanoligenens sp.]
MKTLNLRKYYPSLYPSDCFVELPDEVAEILIASKQNETAYQRRKYYNHAQYSLDRDDGIEQHILYHEPSAEDVFGHIEDLKQLLDAVSALPDIQAKRIYAHYFLGMSRADIAKSDHVTERAVNLSIRNGLQTILKILKKSF